MKCRDYIYEGEPVPELKEQEYPEFFFNFQKAILYSLEQRNLLTQEQRVLCFDVLEKQRIQEKKKKRQA